MTKGLVSFLHVLGSLQWLEIVQNISWYTQYEYE